MFVEDGEDGEQGMEGNEHLSGMSSLQPVGPKQLHTAKDSYGYGPYKILNLLQTS